MTGRVRSRRRTGPRPVTQPLKRMTRAVMNAFPTYDYVDELAMPRPRTRGDCLGGGCNAERPCPWVGCKHHLYLEINEETGSIKFNFPDRAPWELPESCALDVAARGGMTLDEVGDVTNLTRERIRQLEVSGLLKLKREHSEALGA